MYIADRKQIQLQNAARELKSLPTSGLMSLMLSQESRLK